MPGDGVAGCGVCGLFGDSREGRGECGRPTTMRLCLRDALSVATLMLRPRVAATCDARETLAFVVDEGPPP